MCPARCYWAVINLQNHSVGSVSAELNFRYVCVLMWVIIYGTALIPKIFTKFGMCQEQLFRRCEMENWRQISPNSVVLRGDNSENYKT
jgi:hypothetical protein